MAQPAPCSTQSGSPSSSGHRRAGAAGVPQAELPPSADSSLPTPEEQAVKSLERRCGQERSRCSAARGVGGRPSNTVQGEVPGWKGAQPSPLELPLPPHGDSGLGARAAAKAPPPLALPLVGVAAVTAAEMAATSSA